MEVQTPVADLVKRLHSNIDNIHQTIQSLSDTSSHDAELDRLSQERETKVQDLRRGYQDILKALRAQREQEAQQLAEKRRKEEEELEKERQREYEEMMARRAREDEERKRRFEKQQREWERAKEEEERQREKERDMQEKSVQDTIEAKLEKLEDEMERKVEEGKKALRELDENRKAINAQIEEALYAPSIIPKINFRSRAKTTGQLNDDGHNGAGISKETSYTVSAAEKPISQSTFEPPKLDDHHPSKEVKDKKVTISSDKSSADTPYVIDTTSQVVPAEQVKLELHDAAQVEAGRTEATITHASAQEEDPRSLSEPSGQITASEEKPGAADSISEAVKVKKSLLDTHEAPIGQMRDLAVESIEPQAPTLPEPDSTPKGSTALESAHPVNLSPIDRPEETPEVVHTEQDAGAEIAKGSIHNVDPVIGQPEQVEVEAPKNLDSNEQDTTSQHNPLGEIAGDESPSLPRFEATEDLSSNTAHNITAQQQNASASVNNNGLEINEHIDLHEEETESPSLSAQAPTSFKGSPNNIAEPLTLPESSHAQEVISHELSSPQDELTAVAHEDHENQVPAEAIHVRGAEDKATDLSPDQSRPESEESNLNLDDRVLETTSQPNGQMSEEAANPEEIPLPTPTPGIEKNLQLTSVIVPADPSQRIEQDFLVQDKISLDRLEKKVGDVQNETRISQEYVPQKSEPDSDKSGAAREYGINEHLLAPSQTQLVSESVPHITVDQSSEERVIHDLEGSGNAPICDPSSTQNMFIHDQHSNKDLESSLSSDIDAGAASVAPSPTEPQELVDKLAEQPHPNDEENLPKTLVERTEFQNMPRKQYRRTINRDLAAIHGYGAVNGINSPSNDHMSTDKAFDSISSKAEMNSLEDVNAKVLQDDEEKQFLAESQVKQYEFSDLSPKDHNSTEKDLTHPQSSNIDQPIAHLVISENDLSINHPSGIDVHPQDLHDAGPDMEVNHGLTLDTSEQMIHPNNGETSPSPTLVDTKSGRTTPEKPILKTGSSHQRENSTPTKKVQFKDLDTLDTNTKSIYLPPDFDVMDHPEQLAHHETDEKVILLEQTPDTDSSSALTSRESDSEDENSTPTGQVFAPAAVDGLEHDHHSPLGYPKQLPIEPLQEHPIESHVTGANSDDLFDSDGEDEVEEDEHTPQPKQNGSFHFKSIPKPRTPTREIAPQSSADSPVQSSLIQSRWAQLRKNAAERAAVSKTLDETPTNELKESIEGSIEDDATKETNRSPNSTKSELTSGGDDNEDFQSFSESSDHSRTLSDETTKFYESFDQQPEPGQRSRSATTDSAPPYAHSDGHSTPSSPSEAPSSPFQEVPGDEPAISSSWQSPGRSLDPQEEPRDLKPALPVSGDFDPYNPQLYPSYVTSKASDLNLKSRDVQGSAPAVASRDDDSKRAQPTHLSRIVTEKSPQSTRENASPVFPPRDSPRSATPSMESPTRIPRRSPNNRRTSTSSPINPATTSFFQKTRQLFEYPGATAHQISHARTSSPRPLSGLFYTSSASPSSSPSTKSQNGFYNSKPPISPYDETRDGEEPELIPKSLDQDGRAPSPVYTLPTPPPPPPKDRDMRRNSQSPRGSFLGGLGRWAGSGGLEDSIHNPNRRVPEGQPLLRGGSSGLGGRRGGSSTYEGDGN